MNARKILEAKQNAVEDIQALIANIEGWKRAGFEDKEAADKVSITGNCVVDGLVELLEEQDADAESAASIIDELSIYEEEFYADCDEAVSACHCAIQYLNGEFSE